jgi:hypothetical protein
VGANVGNAFRLQDLGNLERAQHRPGWASIHGNPLSFMHAPPRHPGGPQMKIRPLFAWYDLWVGAFWDAGKRRLYILPLPCVGVVIEFRRATQEDRNG